jgi:hypothetical protein
MFLVVGKCKENSADSLINPEELYLLGYNAV